MKYFILSTIFLLSVGHVHAQITAIDSINKLINNSTSDTQRINLKNEKLRILSNGKLDLAILFADSIINEAKQIKYKQGEAAARVRLAGDFCFTGQFSLAKENLDIAKNILLHAQDSTILAKMYNQYGVMYAMQNQFDSSHMFYNKSIEIARLHHDKSALSTALQNNAIGFQQESNYAKALTNYQEALTIVDELKDLEGKAYVELNIAITYTSLGESKRAEETYNRVIVVAEKLDLKNVLAYSYANLASLYGDLNDSRKQYDAAMKAVLLGEAIGDWGIASSSLTRAALALADEGKFEEATKLAQRGLIVADSSRQSYNIFQANGSMGAILHMQKKYDQAIPYFEKAFHSIAQSDIYNAEVGRSYANLSDCYEKTGNFAKALSAYKIKTSISDSILGRENIKKATELTLNYEFQKSQQKLQDEQQKKNAIARARQTGLIIGLILTFILTVVAFRGFRNKRKANRLLQLEKEKVESTLSELRSTQSQLIQSEKMASLGELTAGIAHEIQNPLNFVNNFSEVNAELIDDLKTEALQGNREEVIAIANNIKANEEKINHHGKRADAIVKNMLQHSRSGTGKKEPTDLNLLADEYLRLAYHGIRAKYSSFNASLKTDFDKTIGYINIAPQEIGRVLINLYNNAFYAVFEKEKQETEKLLDATSDKTRKENFVPTVWVKTTKIGHKVEIRIRDNGNGIPDMIKEKIFQPFYTTKPTGEGTGLGLSLSYDIIKAHGGEIKVETKSGEGAEFVIQIPVVVPH